MTDSSQSLPGVLARRLRPLQRVLDLVLPPRCLGCGELVERQGSLCGTCWAAIAFVTDPQCRCCGLPFAFDPGSDADVPRDEAVGAGSLCGACLAAPPAFERARAVMRYDDASRPLLLGFKHGDRTEAAPPFAAWMARSGAEMLATADLFAPVPLPRRRPLVGRSHQAAPLARPQARHACVPADPARPLPRSSPPPPAHDGHRTRVGQGF